MLRGLIQYLFQKPTCGTAHALRHKIQSARDERHSLVMLNQQLETSAQDISNRCKEMTLQTVTRENLENELVLIESRLNANRSRINELAVLERACQQQLDAEERKTLNLDIDTAAYDDAILDINDRNLNLTELNLRHGEYQHAVSETPTLRNRASEIAAPLQREQERFSETNNAKEQMPPQRAVSQRE